MPKMTCEDQTALQRGGTHDSHSTQPLGNLTLFQVLSATSIKSIKIHYLLKIIQHTHTQNRLTTFFSCLQLKQLASNIRQWLYSLNIPWFQCHYAVASSAILRAI